jgi:serine/threonine-protein kinase
VSSPPSSISFAETIEAPLGATSANGHPPNGRKGKCRIAPIGGSPSQTSGETVEVLRSRLRIVSILFFVGFATFLLYRLLFPWDDPTARDNLLTGMHVSTTVLLGVLAIGLCRTCPLSAAKLRVFEGLLFGVPAAFFLLLHHAVLLHCAGLSDNPFIPNLLAAWIMMAFAYALFIPNNWRRALAVLVPITLAPVGLFYYLYIAAPGFRELTSRPEIGGMLMEQPLIMGLTLLACTVGVHTINSLRREAFEAKKLGQYRLKRLIGSGGMGEVYLAEHQLMKRPCAIKLIRPEKAGDPRVLARFEREVRTTAQLSHWNNIDIYDYGRTDDGTFYYVMEYLPGHNIGELVDQHGPLPAARVVHLVKQVCAALAEAHEMGLVHRDLKPANIYSAYRGGKFDVAKVLDFGLAKPSFASEDASLTQEGSITGSPLFMSPEQATGSDDLDHRSDIYSLGAVMYFMLTGRPPFVDDKPLKVMFAHASLEVVPPRSLVPTIPPDLEAVVLRCLEKEPVDRFQSVEDLAAALVEADREGLWDADSAADWWENYGCPERKRLIAETFQAAGA